MATATRSRTARRCRSPSCRWRSDDDVSQRIGIVGFPVTNAAAALRRHPVRAADRHPRSSPSPAMPRPVSPSRQTQAGTDVQIQVESGNITALRTITLPGVGRRPGRGGQPDHRRRDRQRAGLVRHHRRGARRRRQPGAQRQDHLRDTARHVPRRDDPQFFTTERTDANGVASATLTIPAGTARQETSRCSSTAAASRALGAVEVPITVKSSGTTPGAGQPQSIVLDSATPPTIGVTVVRPPRPVDRRGQRARPARTPCWPTCRSPSSSTPSAACRSRRPDRHRRPRASPARPCSPARWRRRCRSPPPSTSTTTASFEIVNQFTPVNIVGGVAERRPLQPGGRVPQHRRPRHLRPRGPDHRVPQRPLRQRRHTGHGDQLHHQRRQRLHARFRPTRPAAPRPP